MKSNTKFIDISINDIPVKFYGYDNKYTLLTRYSLKITEPEYGILPLPSFYFVESQLSYEKKNIVAADIRDRLLDVSEVDLIRPGMIESLQTQWQNLTQAQILILWLLVHYNFDQNQKGEFVANNDIPLDIISSVNRTFFSIQRVMSNINTFAKYITRYRTELAESDKKILSNFRELNKYESVEYSSVNLEEITVEYVMNLPGRENLLELFDSLQVSNVLPFAVLVYNRKRYFKVFPSIIPPNEWININVTDESDRFLRPKVTGLGDGLYIKVLNTSTTALDARKVDLNKIYSDAVWFPNNVVNIKYKITEEIQRDSLLVTNRFFDSFTDINLERLESRQRSVKGTVNVTVPDYDEALMAHSIEMNDLVSFFLYLNEQNKTILEKKRFITYFSLGKESNAIATYLTLTFTKKETEPQPNQPPKKYLEIRISHADSLFQMESVTRTLSKLFMVYTDTRETIIDYYRTFIPNYQVVAVSKSKPVKEDRKTGKRARQLKSINESLFRSGYTVQCQKQKQPYPVTEEEAKKLIKKYKNENKVMNFQGQLYACEPREPDDKTVVKPNIWPGLKVNKSNDDYVKEHPLIPCCYNTDQYNKKGSALRKYLEGEFAADTVVEEEPELFTIKHILGPNKPVGMSRMGEIPVNWNKLLGLMDVEKVTKGKQVIFPYVRYGVMDSPASMVHCLEFVFNEDYFLASKDVKKDMVDKALRRMANIPNIEVGKQELYDLSTDDIRSSIVKEGQYIDTAKYITIAEYAYGCNIYVFVVNDQHPQGSLEIPRHSPNIPYIFRRKNINRITVILFKYDSGRNEYPEQCEVLCYLDEDDNIIKSFRGEPIAYGAQRILEALHDVRIVNSETLLESK